MTAPDPDPTSFAGVRGLVADLAAPGLRALGRRPERRLGGRPGRTHIEVRGLHLVGEDESRRLLVKHLLTLPGVHGAAVNAPLGRVVVDHDPDAAVAELLGAVAEFESTHDLAEAEPADASARHPADSTAATRQLVALATDLVGLGLLAGERWIAPVGPGVAVPPLLTAFLSLADSVPALRSVVERTAGSSSTESWFSLGSAVTQAVGRGPLGLVADACYRVGRAGEAMSRRRGWEAWDRGADLAAHRAEPCPVDERPTALRTGPVEQVGNAAGAVSLGALAVGSWLVPERALALLLAGVPKSARWGREAFAAAAVRAMADAGTLVIDPTAVRRADRIDVVVLGAELDGALDGTLRAAAARVGRVVVTATDTPAAAALVRDAQSSGAGVAVVSSTGAGALAAADLAVGIGGTAPWTADLRCPGVAEALVALEVTAAARHLSRVSAALAVLASSTAAPLALAARLPGLAGTVSAPVTGGALLALAVGTATGTWAARPARPARTT